MQKLRIYMQILIVTLAILAIFLILTVASVTNIFSYLSRPSDLSRAKEAGLKLEKIKGQTVMMVGAHPDDADWYCGSTLSILHKNGNKIVVVVATSGEKGGAAKDLGKKREQEQLKAAKILGYDEVVFLRQEDRNLQANEVFINQIKDLLRKYQPSVVFTFDPIKESYIYRHPDHRASGEATIKALKDFKDTNLYLFHSRQTNVIFDVSSVQTLKVKALNEHKSQRRNRFDKIRWFFFLFRSLPRSGAAMDFNSIGIKYGEVFRLQETSKQSQETTMTEPPEMQVDSNKTYTATMQTSQGDLEIKLFAKEAPKTVNNFVFLAKKGFYDGTIFHRIIKDFMIQAGDPEGTGMGGPGYQFEDEINSIKLVRGKLAMANAGPNTNGSQFFIVTKESTPWLDGKHTVFGEVTKGMDVVTKIEVSETDQNDKPAEDVVVKKVTIDK